MLATLHTSSIEEALSTFKPGTKLFLWLGTVLREVTYLKSSGGNLVVIGSGETENISIKEITSWALDSNART
jgi:hypothetical protein